MWNVLRTIFLFCVGVLLAVVFVYSNRIGPLYAVLSMDNSAGGIRLQGAVPLAQPKRSSIPVRGEIYRRFAGVVFSDSFPASSRIQILQTALDDGSVESLQLIRTDALEKFSNYRAIIFPALKKQGLKSLLRRFRIKDWQDWANSRPRFNWRGSGASIFVDDVSVANSELGVFLDTSAFLFSSLYRTILDGQHFDVRVAMQHLVSNAENIIGHKKHIGDSARSFLAVNTTSDVLFREMLERQRAILVAEVLEFHPEDISSNFLLIAGLAPHYCQKATYKAIAKFILYAATSTGEEKRNRLLSSEVGARILQGYALQDESVKRALSQIFVVGALDALEAGDPNSALSFLHESIAEESGLKEQELLTRLLIEKYPFEAAHLLQSDVGQRKPRKIEARNPRQEASETKHRDSILFHSKPREETNSDDGSVSWFWTIVIIAVVGGAGFYAFRLLNRYRLEQLTGGFYEPFVDEAISSSSAKAGPDFQFDLTGELQRKANSS